MFNFNLLDKSKKYLLGISGGVDSMVLLDVMIKNNYNIAIAHINHNYRKEAIYDYELVKSISNLHDIPLYYLSIDAEAEAKKMKMCFEEGSRNIRYDFFSDILKEYGYDFIILAHNLDDQAETVMYNFIRGSSIIGLSGMQEINNIKNIIRPMLGWSKSDIYEYATNNNIKWNEDYTNHETKYDRCWIRNSLIPSINERKINFKNTITKKAKHFQNISNYFENIVNSWFDNNFNNGFNINNFANEHDVIKGEILSKLWIMFHKNKKGFNENLVKGIINWINKNPKNNSKFQFGKYWLNYNDNYIKIDLM